MPDLGFQLKTHLYNMLVNNLTWEYMDQIEAWKLYIEDVSDVAKSAMDSHTSTLQAANAELQSIQEKEFAMAMLLLNMFATTAIAWVGAAISVKYAPKLTTTTKTIVDQKLKLINDRYLAGFTAFRPTTTTVKVANPIADKMLGDMGKAAAGYVNGLLQKQLQPSAPAFKAPDDGFIQKTNDWQSFRTGMLTALYAQQQQGQQQIRGIANSVENNAVMVGQALVDRLFREQPTLKSLKGTDGDNKRYLAGAAMINKSLNDQRDKWADDWFYYGNDPPQLRWNEDILMERQLWAMWMVEEQIEVVKAVRGEAGFNRGVEMHVVRVKSKSGYLTTSAVRARLMYLGVPILPNGTMPAGMSKNPAAAIDNELFQAVDELDDAGDKTGKSSGRIETYDVGDAEDRLKRAVAHLLNWSKNHIPELGPMDYGVPRQNLTSIEQYTGKYGGSYQH